MNERNEWTKWRNGTNEWMKLLNGMTERSEGMEWMEGNIIYTERVKVLFKGIILRKSWICGFVDFLIYLKIV